MEQETKQVHCIGIGSFWLSRHGCLSVFQHTAPSQQLAINKLLNMYISGSHYNEKIFRLHVAPVTKGFACKELQSWTMKKKKSWQL